MTPIHSGCGSALLNAAMSSLLYRGGTLGETLRDAENYMFCVEELKARRGHKGKGQGGPRGLEFPPLGRSRVAGPAQSARRAAASARAGGMDRRRHAADRLARVAASRGPQREIRGQHVSQQPDRGAAENRGRVDEDGSRRSITSACRCRRAWPAATSPELEPSRSDAKRVDARIDRSRGLLYLVYYPEQENPGESVVLHLKAVTAAEQARRLSK